MEILGIGAGRSLPGNFICIGAVDDVTRDEILADVAVLVAPKLGGESFGSVLAEALAAGCDVVASEIPAFVELLGEGEACVDRLVPPNDPVCPAGTVADALRRGPVATFERRMGLARRFG